MQRSRLFCGLLGQPIEKRFIQMGSPNGIGQMPSAGL
jgi:hypothetical protein